YPARQCHRGGQDAGRGVRPGRTDGRATLALETLETPIDRAPTSPRPWTIGRPGIWTHWGGGMCAVLPAQSARPGNPYCPVLAPLPPLMSAPTFFRRRRGSPHFIILINTLIILVNARKPRTRRSTHAKTRNTLKTRHIRAKRAARSGRNLTKDLFCADGAKLLTRRTW